MPPITVTISGRTGTASDFIGGLCSERLVFTGDALTLPAKVALLDLDGTPLAAAELQSNDTGAVFADLSTDTQQVADRYRYQPTDTLNRATLFIGDDTSLQAVIEVQVKKNWLDDAAYHPPAPLPEYWTKEEVQAAIDAHAKRKDNPHAVTAAQVGALTETTANGLYPRFRNEDATTTVGNNHGRNVMASQNGENGGFYVTGVAGNPPSRKQWLTEYQRNRVRVYTATSGESKDYYWDDTPSGDAEKAILRWCDLFAQAVTTVWRGIMRMCNPRIAANADDASKDIALVPNANGAGLQVQFPVGATAMIRAKTGTLATVAEVNEKDASTLAEAKAYADGKVVDVYRFKGSVATKEALPTSGNTVGDVWNVSENGMNYAWTGEEWDALGTSVDLSAYYTKTEADGRYLQLTGGTLTGNVNASGSVTIKVPILHATSYFSTPMLCNEPGQYAKNHALLLGYAYHDYWEFLENGGDYRFYMHQETAGIHKQVARITEAGIYEGSTLLANKYAAKTHTHTTAQVTGLDAALAAKANAADVYKKTETYSKAEVDGKVAVVYRFKGTVENKGALPSSGNTVGDVWDVSEDGMNYAWTGEAWDALGASVDLSAYSTTAQADARYLKLTGATQTVTASVNFNGADNYMTALRFGGTAAAAGLKTRGICGWNVLNQKNGLFLNYDGRDVSTEEYFSAGEKRGVYICGGLDTTNQTCLVLRKMDGDTFYAPKTQTYTKDEVDQKITSALGDIQAALAAI